ncbi:unnamed protein product [Timema podura]|uniref:Uncharacterized protein n=1 Tax=Timema podura TaxID=61482 RepID=A0ABN7NYY8_TIMPD|nr:unnamed protein product [Timema podura]
MTKVRDTHALTTVENSGGLGFVCPTWYICQSSWQIQRYRARSPFQDLPPDCAVSQGNVLSPLVLRTVKPALSMRWMCKTCGINYWVSVSRHVKRIDRLHAVLYYTVSPLSLSFTYNFFVWCLVYSSGHQMVNRGPHPDRRYIFKDLDEIAINRRNDAISVVGG